MSEHIHVDNDGQTTFERIRKLVESGVPMPVKFCKDHNVKLTNSRKWSWRIGLAASIALYLFITIHFIQWLRT